MCIRDSLTSDGFLGVGTGVPTEKLHVVGDFRLVGAMYATQYIQTGQYTNLQRSAIIPPANGMIIYNRSVNRFQGYQNGAWINMDDGTAAPFTPPATYAIATAGSVTSINEGSVLTLNVTTTNVTNGTTLYWTVSRTGDFTVPNGSITITSGAATFTVTPRADNTTEGPELLTVSIRTTSINGPIVATTPNITINDTSLTP